MKTGKKILILLLTLSMVQFDFSVINASDTESVGEDTSDDFDSVMRDTEDNGFDHIKDINPYLREVYSNLNRSAEYVLFNLDTNAKKTATKRQGNNFYVNGKWISKGDLFAMELINTSGQKITTRKTYKLYSEALTVSKYDTGKKLAPGTYSILKKSLDTYYVSNGSNSGWIMVGVGEVTVNGTRQYLSVDNVGGVKVNKKIIAKSMNIRPAYGMKPKYVTIHNTGNTASGSTAKAHADLQYNRSARNDEVTTSWHFTVDNKEIWQSVPMNEVAYHAGDGYGMGNDSTIAIEICENKDGNYAQAEKNAVKLTARILYDNGLPATAIKMHKDWSGKNCPQNMIELTKGSMGWTAFKKAVENEYNRIATPVKLSVSSKSLIVGQSFSLKATGATSFAWSSSNAAVASVDQTGKVTAKKTGDAVITVKAGNGKSAISKIHVDPITVKMQASEVTVYTGIKYQLKASTNNGQAVSKWSSSNTAIAEIDNNGIINGKKAGSVIITATTLNNSAKASMKVNVVNPYVKLNTNTLLVYEGYTGTLKATTGPANQKVVWSSSNNSIATVNSTGIVTGIKAGSATITATYNGKKASCKITVVKPSFTLNSSAISIYKGYGTSLTATTKPTDQKVTWSSSNTAIATVSSAGYVKGIKAGTAIITANFKGMKKTVRVTVSNPTLTLNKSTLSVYKNYGYTLKATTKPGSQKVTWSSSNRAIASVDSKGYVKGKKAGTVTITANFNGIKRTCKVTVKNTSIKVPKTATAYKGVAHTLKATTTPANGKVTWSSSNKSLATVSSKGVITGKKTGKVTIYATFNGKRVSCKVTIKKPSLSVSKSSITISRKKSYSLTAKAVPNKKVTWSSSNKNIATVTSNGKVTGKKKGTVYIYAKANGLSKKIKVTVK